MLASDLPVCCVDKNGELWECCQIATEGIDLTPERKKRLQYVQCSRQQLNPFIYMVQIHRHYMLITPDEQMLPTTKCPVPLKMSPINLKEISMVHCQKL